MIKLRARTVSISAMLMGTVGFTFTLNAQQSGTVIGAGSLARDCYDRSQHASREQTASLADLRLCDRAIFAGSLRQADLAATYSNRGVIRMAMRDYKQAYKDYERALELDRNLAETYINRGNLWLAVQQHQRAIDDYNSAIERGTKKEKIVLLNRGLAHEQMGAFELAKQDYQAALNLDSKWQSAIDKLERVNRKLAVKPNE